MNDDPESPGGEKPSGARAPAPAADNPAPAPAADNPAPAPAADNPAHAPATDNPAHAPATNDINSRDPAEATSDGGERMPEDVAPDESPREQEPHAGPDNSGLDAGDLSLVLDAFADRIVEARGRYADFDRVAFDPAVPVSAAMAETIARSDHGPDIAYQLGRSPDLARRIAGLDPLSAARELGRIEATLSPTAARKVTGAPPPIRTLDGAESPRRDPDAMTYDQYKRWRSAR